MGVTFAEHFTQHIFPDGKIKKLIIIQAFGQDPTEILSRNLSKTELTKAIVKSSPQSCWDVHLTCFLSAHQILAL